MVLVYDKLSLCISPPAPRAEREDPSIPASLGSSCELDGLARLFCGSARRGRHAFNQEKRSSQGRERRVALKTFFGRRIMYDESRVVSAGGTVKD